MKSGEYGIANLKRILPKLITWAQEAEGDGNDYAQLEEMYEAIYGQMGKYVRHATTNIGGVIERAKTTDQEGVIYTPVDKNTQQRAMQFLDKQLFQTPNWLLDKAILQRIEPMGATERLRRFQDRALRALFDEGRLKRIDEASSLYGLTNSYTLIDLFEESKASIFSEIKSGNTIDGFRQNLQRAYIDKIADLMKKESADFDYTSAKAIARGTLKSLQKEVIKAAAKQTDLNTKYHLEDLEERIDRVLNPEQ